MVGGDTLMRWLSKTKLYAAAAFVGAVFLALVRADAKRDQRRKSQREDYKHADDIERRVTANRNDPDRLRPYEGSGYRD